MKAPIGAAYIPLRIPSDMRDWIEKEASRTMGSLNNEILRCIRAKMDAEQRERAAG
jgi:hypothetical protein